MQLALVGAGFQDGPLVIPWWSLLTFLLIVYHSSDLESLCSFSGGALLAFVLLRSLIDSCKEVSEINSFEEYFDLIHPDLIIEYNSTSHHRTRVWPWIRARIFDLVPSWRPGRIIREEQIIIFARLFRIDMSHQLLDFAPDFEGRETEQNWYKREKDVVTMRGCLPHLDPEIKALWLTQIKPMLDGLLKTANSLRTTVSTNGCLLFQALAKEYGSGMDSMVEILLQNFIKLCANTKPIARSNANDTVLAIIAHVSYHVRIVQHIHNACQDKNVQPRKFACEWLKKVIKRHSRGTIEHYGGLELIEKSIKLGLEDRDKNVREAMRPTYWTFARRWPERSDVLFSTLDKIKQDQLTADPSNHTAHPITTVQATSAVSEPHNVISAPPKASTKDSEAENSNRRIEQTPLGSSAAVTDKVPIEAAASTTGSGSAAAGSKPSLKDVKSQMRKAHDSRDNSKGVTDKVRNEVPLRSDTLPTSSHAKPTLKEIKAALKKAQIVHNDANGAISDKRAEAFAVQKAPQPSDEDFNSVKDQPQNDAQAVKAGSISAAPLRRKKPATTKGDQSQGKDADIEPQSVIRVDAPEDKTADATPIENTVLPTETTENEAADAALPHDPDCSSPQKPQGAVGSEGDANPRVKFFEQAARRIMAREMNIDHFRILQTRLKHDVDQPIWGDLIIPLCEWLETTLVPTEAERLEWQEEQYQVLATLRLLLTNKLWADGYYSRICLTLTSTKSWYRRHGAMVTGIRKGLNFVINHGNILEMFHQLCEAMECEHEEDNEELLILSLGAMLHRLHTDPVAESQFYQALGAESEIVNRLASIGSAAIKSELASIRHVAIRYAQEFWYHVPEDQFYDLIAGGDEKTENLLRYYINRHQKIDDHLEEL